MNQQWPANPETPHGAWEFHEHLIPNTPVKPIRIWMEVGDRDNFNPNVMSDNMHDWVLANENMAKVLAAKGYHYQFVFARNAGHTDRAVKQQTLPEAWSMSGRDTLSQGRKIDLSGVSHRTSVLASLDVMRAITQPARPDSLDRMVRHVIAGEYRGRKESP